MIGIGSRSRLLSKLPLMRTSSEGAVITSRSALRSSALRFSSASRTRRSAASFSFLFLAASASAFAFCSRARASASRRSRAAASALRLASAAARAFWRATSSAIRRSIWALSAASFFFCWSMMPWMVFCSFCSVFTTFCCSTCLPSSSRRSRSPLASSRPFSSRALLMSCSFWLTSSCCVFTSSPCTC